MAISGIGNNYSNVYGSTYTAQKNETVKKTETKEVTVVDAIMVIFPVLSMLQLSVWSTTLAPIALALAWALLRPLS